MDDLKKLNRAELIEIIYALQQSEADLQAKNTMLQAQLDDKTLKAQEAGTLAAEAVRLNGVFEAAQAAADQYLAAVHAANASVDAECAKRLRMAEDMGKKALLQVRQQCDDLQAETERDLARQKDEAEREVKRRWSTFRLRVYGAVKVTPELAKLLDGDILPADAPDAPDPDPAEVRPARE